MPIPKLEILAYDATDLGLLCLRRRALAGQPDTTVTEVTLNHEFLMSSLHTASEQALARIAIEMHQATSLRVLIGGLGLGYTARESLNSNRVAQVDVVELLPQVIRWLHDGLIPLSTQLNKNPRCSVFQGDVYQRLDRPPTERFDMILIDVDHSPDERLNDKSVSFYTVAGLQNACQHLEQDGILAVWSYAENSPFASALRQVFDEVRVEPITYRNQLIDESVTDWLFFARHRQQQMTID